MFRVLEGPRFTCRILGAQGLEYLGGGRARGGGKLPTGT